MSDDPTNFHVPAGVRVQGQPEPWAAGLRYLSRPPMWEPPAQPTYPQMIFAAPAPVLDRQLVHDRQSVHEREPAQEREPVLELDPVLERPPAPEQPSSSAIEVRRMVEGLLRLTLEIVDRRRRPEQLRDLATASVVDAMAALALSRPPGRELGSATLRKIRIVSAGDGAAEICASYTRGPRVFAIAGRVERRRGTWVATTLLLA